jgi:hypothetical protein
MSNLKIQLDPREDREQNIFYIGRLTFPGTVSFSTGITFLVFIAESGEEEIQITKNNKENATYSKFSKRDDRLKVALEPRQDQYGKTYYVAKLKFNGTIDCSSDVVFLVFCSKSGSEELQIVGKFFEDNKNVPKEQQTQIVYKSKIIKPDTSNDEMI